MDKHAPINASSVWQSSTVSLRSVCLQAVQLRCERFMCENFHKILDDPLLQVGDNDDAHHEQRQLGMNGIISFLHLALCRV